MITIIAAVAANNIIGTQNGSLPWKIPEEMKFFKETTTGNTVIMGRITFASIGRALPNRNNIVVSTTLTESELPPGVFLAHTLDEALTIAEKFQKENFIIGGAVLYNTAIAVCNRLLLSHIKFEAEGTVSFPEFNPDLFTVTVIAEHSDFTIKE